MLKQITIIAIFLISRQVLAQNEHEWLIESGITFNHYQAQVKAEVGDPRGERLTNNFELGLNISSSYKWNKWFASGLFVRLDRGQREMAFFDGFDSEGKTSVKEKVGGTYSELWFGPVIQAFWKHFTFELGYGLVGIRKDNGRKDIPNSSGETDGAFTLNPTVAWLVNLGGFIPLNDALDVTLKIEYRGRYYNERGGKKLFNNIDHGTQSIVPVLGVRWNL
jgi:hypothetical protein